MPEKELKKPHNLTVDNRQRGQVTGVIRVIASNDTQLVLETTMGGLTILGADFKIIKFNADEGFLSYEGSTNSVKYTTAKLPLLKRMFS